MRKSTNYARRAGWLYLTLIPLGVFGILFVPSYFIVEDDIQATMDNIGNDEFLFRLSITSSLLTQVLQVLVVLALYEVLKRVNKQIAIFMVISILPAVSIAMLNELNYLAVLESLGDEETVSTFLSLHEYGVFIAQIFWGIWLFPMGCLAYKSGFIPKLIGVLLIIACFGYVIDSFVLLLDLEIGIVFSDFTFLGEPAIVFWLLFKGGKQLSANRTSGPALFI